MVRHYFIPINHQMADGGNDFPFLFLPLYLHCLLLTSYSSFHVCVNDFCFVYDSSFHNFPRGYMIFNIDCMVVKPTLTHAPAMVHATIGDNSVDKPKYDNNI
jgi:hypothetical protein